MRVDLIELLRTRAIAHPSRIVRVESPCDMSCSFDVVGYPWWTDGATGEPEGKLTIRLEGITSGKLDIFLFGSDPSDEDLEAFDAHSLSAYPWAQGNHCQIFCSDPLQNPLDIYAILHDFLASSKCPFNPSQYLNMGFGSTFFEFQVITSERSYLLCNGPESICEIVASELKARNVGFRLLRRNSPKTNEILVEIEDSQIICKSATAIFEKPTN